MARLKYARHLCHLLKADLAKDDNCSASGFVCVADSPEKIATDQKRQRDLEMGQMLGDLGQALLDSRPRQCSGRIGLSRSFHTTCW